MIERNLTLDQVIELRERRRRRVIYTTGFYHPLWKTVCRVGWRLYTHESRLRGGYYG